MSPQVMQNINTLPAGLLPHELAAYLFGLAISSPLYAVSICQAIFYFRTYHHDPHYLKCTVYTLIVMGSIRFACLTHTVYMSFVTLNDVLHHVDRQITCHENLVRQITLMMVEFLGASLSCIVQSAYVVRLWHLSDRNRLLAGVIMLPTLCQFGSGLAVVGGLVFDATGQGLGLCSFGGPFEIGARSDTLNTINEVSRYSQLFSSLASDALITLSMFYYLRGGLNLGTRFVGTKCLVTLLISYTLAIGLVMSIISLTALVIFATEATQAYLPVIHFMISNIYVNSYLTSLNWRMGLRNLGPGSSSLSTQSSLSFRNETTRDTLLCAVSRLVMAILHPRKFSVESSAAQGESSRIHSAPTYQVS